MKLAYIIVILLAFSSISYKLTAQQPGFEILPINEELETEMIAKTVFGEGSPIPIKRLRLLKLKHYDFNGEVKTGEIVVLDAVSDYVLQLFIELYQKKFPMTSINLLTKYHGDDNASMADNNTSGHNYRQVANSKRLSLHAYGTAIDLNPLINPYVLVPCETGDGLVEVQPAAGIKYLNRRENRIGKENRKGLAEEVIDVFAKNGFYWWGGYWNCPIDYQHFQVSRKLTNLLVAMNPEDSKRFFSLTVKYFNQFNKPFEDYLSTKIGGSLIESYREAPGRFFNTIENF